jgi:hypothetical protein
MHQRYRCNLCGQVFGDRIGTLTIVPDRLTYLSPCCLSRDYTTLGVKNDNDDRSDGAIDSTHNILEVESI